MNRATTPKAALAALDHTTFPNRATEDEVRRDVARRVHKQVGKYEHLVQNQAADYRFLAAEWRQVADDLADEMRSLETAIRTGGLATEHREQWLALDAQVRQVARRGLELVEQAEPLAQKADDPLSALQRLYERFPALGQRTSWGI